MYQNSAKRGFQNICAFLFAVTAAKFGTHDFSSALECISGYLEVFFLHLQFLQKVVFKFTPNHSIVTNDFSFKKTSTMSRS